MRRHYPLFGQTTKSLFGISSSSVRTTRLLSSSSSSSSWRFQQQNSPTDSNCRILLAGCHFQGGYHYLKQQQKQILTDQQQHQLEFVLAPTPALIQELAPTVDVAIPFMEKFDATFFATATRLKLCIQYGVGLEGIDLEAATKAGVVVSNVPASLTGNAQATSEHALYLTMSLLRNKNNVLQKRFQKQILGGIPMPQSIFGKQVTVVGYGNVGRVLCHYFQTMGANVTVVRNQQWDENENEYEDTTNTTTTTSTIVNRANSLQEVLPTTQILVLACTMTKETYHIINDETISLLPPGGESIIVNVGRGPLVNHNAILTALEEGKIAGFASDVGIDGSSQGKPSEPWDPSDKLSKHPNTIFTPHVGGYTDYSYQQMANRILIAIKRVVLEGKPPPVWVNSPYTSS